MRPGSREAPLSEAQRAAVTHTGGPLLVLAGAGAGKTRVLSTRAAWLVDQGIEPVRIVVATFTNRATAEFRGRLRQLLGEQALELWMGTLHSVGARLLRRYGAEAEINPAFRTIGPRESRARLAELAETHQMGSPRLRVAREAISRFKGMRLPPEAVTAEHLWGMVPLAEEVAFLYAEYERSLKERDELDLDDLVGRAVELLERAPQVRQRLGLAALLVDEAQDVDPAQLALIEALLLPGASLTLVGDSDQAVYRWRGAKAEFMREFEVRFPGGKTIALGQNYRCDRRIVAAAAELIRQNPSRREHRLWSERRDGQAPLVQPLLDDEQEAAWVVGEIEGLHQVRGWPWRSCAILYRANWLSQAFEDALVAKSIPYHVIGSRFWQRLEVSEALAYLQLVADPDDLSAVYRLVENGRRQAATANWPQLIEAQAEGEPLRLRVLAGEALPLLPDVQQRLVTLYGQLPQWQNRAAELGLSQLLFRILSESGAREKWERRDRDRDPANLAVPNLNRLLVLIARYFPGAAPAVLPDFLSYVESMQSEEGPGERDAVQLLTLHGAKGMEFPAVFVVGCEEGLIPHWQSDQVGEYGQAALEEERRLLYVGMTRAERRLTLTYAKARRGAAGPGRAAARSRFLGEIPEALLQWRELPDMKGGEG